MTNMAKNLPFLPPEIWRIVASYMDRQVLLALSMTSRFCARLFTGLYYNNWEVECCNRAQNATIRESHEIYNSTNMDGFFRALKSGFAPAYARRVHFYFCMHSQPVHHAESCSKKSLQTKQTREFLKLLNASEIVVIINDPHQGFICNEPFLKNLLRHSLRALPNAVVKLRVDNREAGGIDPGSFYFTIRDSSTSRATVADNLQRAFTRIEPWCINYHFWDASELYILGTHHEIVGIYPNVTDLTLTHGYVSKDHFPWSWNFIPCLNAFPQCQRLTCRWETFGYYERLETTFCFYNAPAQERVCTRILVHGELCKWVLWLLKYRKGLDHVEELEFHHAEHDSSVGEWPFPYTSATLTALVTCLSFSLPSLEKIILKFGAGAIILGPNHPGTLSKGLCERCELAVDILEFDIRTMVQEGTLHVVNPNGSAAIDLVLKVWQDESIDKLEFSEFSSQLKAPISPKRWYERPIFPHVNDLFQIEKRGSRLGSIPELVPPYVIHG